VSRMRRGNLGRVRAATALVVAMVLAACTGGGGVHPTGTPDGSTSVRSGPGPTGSGTTTSPNRDGATPLGVKWDGSRFTQFEPYLSTLRGGSTFYELVWCDVERTQGHQDWSTADKIATRSRQVGITLMVKLRVGSCWATGTTAQFERGNLGKTESAMPKDLNAYRAWVRTAVQRYSALGVHQFAVENEVNSPSFWGGTPDQYGQLVEAASQAIRAADPNAQVVDGGLSSTTYGFGIAQSLLDQAKDDQAVTAYNLYYSRRFGTRGDQLPEVRDVAGLRTVLHSDQGARNLAYLAQATALAERHVVDIRQVHFYEKYDAVPLLFDYLRAHTPRGVPIEAWEVGRFSKSGNDAGAEAEMVKTVSQFLALGADVVIWLPLAFNDKGRNADEPRIGLLDPDGTVRQLGTQFAAMAGAARGASVVPIMNRGLSGVGLERSGSTTLFLWADSPRAVSIRAGDAVGAVGAAQVSASDQSVSIGGTPLQLTVKESVSLFLGAQVQG